MAKTVKNIRLENSLIRKVSLVADEFNDGNFTAAIESLINQALLMRELDLQTRWNMYDSVKQSEYDRTEKETGNPNVRHLIDALHI